MIGPPESCSAVGSPNQGRVMFKSIVVGTDGSDTATQAVRQAVDLAAPWGRSWSW